MKKVLTLQSDGTIVWEESEQQGVGYPDYEDMIRSGSVFTCRSTTKNNTFSVYPANTIRMIPMYFQRDTAFNFVWMWLGDQNAQGPSNSFKLGIYATDESYYPTTLVSTFSYPLDTPGWRGGPWSFTFLAGQLYWVALLLQNTGMIAQWEREYSVPTPLKLRTPADPGGCEYANGWQLSWGWGGLPSVFPSGAIYDCSIYIPVIYFTKA
jgi:hypothetical protein